MITQKMRIGEVIRTLRHRRNLTQRALARRAGLTDSNLSRIERGSVTPRLPLLADIAEALGIPLRLLLWWAAPMPAAGSDVEATVWRQIEELVDGLIDTYLTHGL
jgi:transcriptional regulator with XRE-family HTH domain